ncbi:MAG: 4-(cytidine 5'-diphospho)-2-C-methyl-D-erythritol kinase [Planctomycetota bacterium]|nr:4-(cytidine 5'-diphospho)-2-C-methyl-D-erythritol kinase [Planctomycetota bacterium]
MSLLCPNKVRYERTADGALLWRAPAKINLTLRVGGRRDDGYHELDSTVAKVTLYDELILRPRPDGQIRLTCSGLDCGATEENLVLRAAKLMGDRSNGADIELIKRIPAGAGLGGGSSDAASVLSALNQLWQLNLSRERLINLAEKIGSDAPLFLDGPAVRMQGRGEIIEPVTIHPFAALLYLPNLHCRTEEVYASYDADGNPQSTICNPQLEGPPSRWRSELFNDLTAAAVRVCPPLADISSRLAEATGLPVHMTGSGSAMFVICDDRVEAQSSADRLGDKMKNRCRIVLLNRW